MVGVSGHVVIDDMAGREPNFLIRGFDKNMKMISLAEALMYKPDGKVEAQFLIRFVSVFITLKCYCRPLTYWYPKE